ncbi:MAG: Rieske (2Fe-2S) protein [Bacteroidetes bacterium]|nr:Rieske (2Fe-2S) protein [Bacteroidota bacterium]MBS1930998.1 Rieske (2Fe-2S) protein [Bacteroidota bacterium]
MERKEFIRSSCNACLLLAAGYLLPTVAGCVSGYSVFKTSVVNNLVTMPIAMFDKSTLQLVRPKGWLYDIAVEKRTDGSFAALLLQCTHQENQLKIQGNGFHCSLHGSEFDKNGNVTKGPAERPLQQYKTFVDKDQIIIQILKSPQ